MQLDPSFLLYIDGDPDFVRLRHYFREEWKHLGIAWPHPSDAGQYRNNYIRLDMLNESDRGTYKFLLTVLDDGSDTSELAWNNQIDFARRLIKTLESGGYRIDLHGEPDLLRMVLENSE